MGGPGKDVSGRRDLQRAAGEKRTSPTGFEPVLPP